MRVPPFALADRVVERGHEAKVDVSGTLREREMSPPSEEGCEACQKSGPPQQAGDGQDMRYNDSDHKETPDGRWGW